MAKGLSSRQLLDRGKPIELTLELLSFSGGINEIGEDHELQSNEARDIENWDSTSLGGMERSEGFSLALDGTGTYTDQLDLCAHHFEGTSTAFFGVIEGDVVQVSGSTLVQEDAAAFTSGVLCHSVSAGSKLWITNSTDNLKYKTIAGAITTPSDQPSSARDRVYEHNFRLFAEGGGTDIYGSRVGSGNWTAADAWSASNDAWSMTMPDITQGAVMGFPSGPEITVFTEFDTYVISNQPNVTRRRVQNGIGCIAPYAIARGNEGVFLFSTYPTKGIFLWNGVEFQELTRNRDFIDDVDETKRMFGFYKNREYHFIYNESGSGVTYPNRMQIFNTKFGRWKSRPVNAALSDNFGYPVLLTKDNNEAYIGSSSTSKVYDFKDGSTSDAGQETEANYKTKHFTSRDFSGVSGGVFPVDNVRLKLTKVTSIHAGSTGTFSIQWTADRGAYSGSQTFDLNVDGADLINTTFTVNTSNIIGISDIPDKRVTKTFNNSAIGKEFQFQILNSDTGARPKIKKLKIHAIAYEEE